MNIWEILNIEATDDINAIRKAYAARAAVCHPEEQPEAFMELREAYRQATALAKATKNAGAAKDRSQGQEQGRQQRQAQQQEQNQHQRQNQQQAAARKPGGFSFFGVTGEEGQESLLSHPGITGFRELYLSGQRRDRKKWDLYFSSPQFLGQAKNEAFLKAMLSVVEENLEDFPPTKEFQTELAIIYRFLAVEYQDYTDFVLGSGAGFAGIRTVLAMAKKGPFVRSLRGNDAALQAGYHDYWQLCSLAAGEFQTRASLLELGNILDRYASAYLKEKCSGTAAYERNILSLRLLEYFFQANELPEQVYEELWHKFDLGHALMGRNRVLYGRLRDIALKKYPGLQTKKEERFSELNASFSQYAKNCFQRQGREPEADKQETEAFFSREDFSRALNNFRFVENHLLTDWITPDRCPAFLDQLEARYRARGELPFCSDVLRLIQETKKKKQQLYLAREDEEAVPSRETCHVFSRPFLRYYISAAFWGAEAPEDGSPLYGRLQEDFPTGARWEKQLALLLEEQQKAGNPLRKTYTLNLAETGGQEGASQLLVTFRPLSPLSPGRQWYGGRQMTRPMPANVTATARSTPWSARGARSATCRIRDTSLPPPWRKLWRRPCKS